MSQTRGWFPQEPKIDIIRSANVNLKLAWTTSLPLVTSGALMIIAAALSAYFGLNLIESYRTSLANGRFVQTDYPSLYVALLSFVSFGLDLFAALLLLLRKYVGVAEILAVIVLACGLAAPWIFIYFHSPLIYMYWEQFLLQGLFVASPMIVLSLVTLILVRLNRKQFKQDNMRWTTLPFTVSGALVIIASVPFAYNGLYLLWVAAFSGSALANYYVAYLDVLLNLLMFGAFLFLASLLLKRKRVGIVTIIIGASLVVGLPIQFSLLKGFGDPVGAFGLPTIACLIATLILVGLNYQKFKQEVNIKTLLENSVSLKSEASK
jgi:hypothetical protein